MNRRYRKTIIAGNWKMNKTPSEAKAQSPYKYIVFYENSS